MIDPDRWDAPDIGDLAREDPDSMWSRRVAAAHQAAQARARARHAEEDHARARAAQRRAALGEDGRGWE